VRKRMSTAKRIALSGVLLALVVIVLYAESIAPTSKLTLYALSSFFVSVIVMESGVGSGWFFYVASSLLSLIIVPDKLDLVPYFAFFGVYGILKYYIERLNKLILEYILKYAFFNVCLVAAIVEIKDMTQA
jgi:uncharacterized membrane protein YedE/YeeE